ncbi:MAG: peptidylprolyl isomerase, partial [Thermoguttaceae bacterium]
QQRQNEYIVQIFPGCLKEQIEIALMYYDFTQASKPEGVERATKQMGDVFDAKVLPDLMKKFNVESRAALNRELEKVGSSIEREKQQAVRQNIALYWKRNCISEATGECTHDEMLEYYNTHLYEYEHKARVKWRQLSASFAKSGSREEAYNKIVWMGNQLCAKVPFDQIAKEHSDGPTAKEGGDWKWTAKGVLASAELEKAIFQIKVGVLSRIIEDKTGFHIIQVQEREEDRCTPFLESQADIRKKIKNLRMKKKEDEFIADLYKKYKPETYQNAISRIYNHEPQVVLPQDPGTSLHNR